MKKRFIVLSVLNNLLYTVSVLIGYKLGIKYLSELLYIPLWFVRIFYGIIGYGAVSFVMLKLKFLTDGIIKYLFIYSLANKGKLGLKASLIGCMSNFKNLSGIIICNKIIRDFIEYTFEEIKDNIGFKPFFEFLIKLTKSTILGSIMDKIARIQIKYIDEYVLYYSFKHKCDSMYNGVKLGFKSYIKNTKDVSSKIIANIVMGLLIKVVFIIAYIAVRSIYYTLTVESVIFSVIMSSTISTYIITEGVLEPIMMKSILRCANKSLADDVEIFDTQNFDMLKQLDKFQIV